MDQQANFFTAAEQAKTPYITKKRLLLGLGCVAFCTLVIALFLFLSRPRSPYPYTVVVAGQKEIVQNEFDQMIVKVLATTEARHSFQTPVGLTIMQLKEACKRDGDFFSGCTNGKSEELWRDANHFELAQEISCWGRGLPNREFKTRWLVDLPAGQVTPLNDDARAFMNYPQEINRMVMELEAKDTARRNRPSLKPAEIIAEVSKDGKVPNEFTYDDIVTRWFPGPPKVVLQATSHDSKRVLTVEGVMPGANGLTEGTVLKVTGWWKPYMEWALGPRDIEAGEKAIQNAWVDRNTSARLRGQSDSGTGFGLGPGYSIQCDLTALDGKHRFTFTLRSY